MHVCHITSAHPRYDIRIFHKECISLAKHGYAVTLVVADGFGSEVKNGVTISDVGNLGGRMQRLWNGPKLVYKRVLELNPQVVHFHDPELIDIAYKLSKKGFRVIYDVHEDVPKQVLSKAWIPMWLRPLVSKVVQFQEWRRSRHFSGIVCVTEFIAKRFKNYNPNTVIVHNYPILAEFNQIDIDWNKREDHLCYIGSISETRGLVTLVDSLAENKLRLDLAGLYSDGEIKNKLEQSLGYEYVTYHGVLNRTQVMHLLSKVRIGVVTLYPTPSALESLATKILEYMIAGIPLITSNFEAWRPIVEGYNCGLMVNPCSAHEIAKAAKWFIDHPQEAQIMGANGRKAVLAHYIWDMEQLVLIDFYEAIRYH